MDGELRRLLEVAATVGKAQWVLVDDGGGLAARLAQHAGLRKLGAQALAVPPGAGDWSRYAAAAGQAQGARLLLLPGGCGLPGGLYKAQTAALARAQVVFSRRPGGSGLAYRAQDWVWGLPGLDLGAPVLAERQRLLTLLQAVPAGRFYGLRTARLALKSGVAVAQVGADLLPPPPHAAAVLGEGDGLTRALRGGLRVALGALLFTVGLVWLMRVSNMLGLCVMGLGFFMVFAVVGEE
jgi:hypothetical protein